MIIISCIFSSSAIKKQAIGCKVYGFAPTHAIHLYIKALNYICVGDKTHSNNICGRGSWRFAKSFARAVASRRTTARYHRHRPQAAQRPPPHHRQVVVAVVVATASAALSHHRASASASRHHRHHRVRHTMMSMMMMNIAQPAWAVST